MSMGTETTGELLREGLEETRRLVQLEVSLARGEVRKELAQARTGAIAFGIAAVVAIAALAMLLVAIPLAFGASACTACVVAGVLALVSGTAAVVGWKSLPKELLGTTRSRLESDYKQLKERIT
jgi:uncharacterized membrane protein YqjE